MVARRRSTLIAILGLTSHDCSGFALVSTSIAQRHGPLRSTRHGSTSSHTRMATTATQLRPASARRARPNFSPSGLQDEEGGSAANSGPVAANTNAASGSDEEKPGAVRKSNALGWYLKRMRQIELLTSEEEISLARQIQLGLEFDAAREELRTKLEREPSRSEWAAHVGVDTEILQMLLLKASNAKNTMVRSNLRLAVSIAKRYTNRGMSLSDLVQEATFGLVKASERFDPERGFKFSTYASWWIKQSILRAVADQSRIIRLPVHVHELLNSINKATVELASELGRPPTDDELAGRLQVATHKIEFYKEAAQGPVSMEQAKPPTGNFSASSAGSANDMTMADDLKDEKLMPEELSQQIMLKDNVSQLLGTLSPREQEVVRLRFGIDDGRARTLEEIGQVFAVTRERVRQIESRALQKLRQPYRNYKLRAYTLEPEIELASL